MPKKWKEMTEKRKCECKISAILFPVRTLRNVCLFVSESLMDSTVYTSKMRDERALVYKL